MHASLVFGTAPYSSLHHSPGVITDKSARSAPLSSADAPHNTATVEVLCSCALLQQFASMLSSSNIRSSRTLLRALLCIPQHVVARLFYPSKPAGLLQRPLTWIRAYQYAQGEGLNSMG